MDNDSLHAALTAANRELARLNQAKSDFIRVASHELLMPVTKARSYSDILSEMSEDGSLTPDLAKQMSAGISKAARHLEEIVDTMFMITQIDTQTLSLDLSETSMAMVVHAAAKAWATALEQRQHTLIVQGVAELPAITVDAKRLYDVLSHLVQNAIKYTPDGGQIRITARLIGGGMSPQDQSVEIVVADTGIGIPAEDLEHIFEKFYRVGDVMLHSTGKTKFKGAGPGLGLAIVRGIVEAHGGRIWAESPGHDEATCPGSQFHIVLPIQPLYLEAEGSPAFLAPVPTSAEEAVRIA